MRFTAISLISTSLSSPDCSQCLMPVLAQCYPVAPQLVRNTRVFLCQYSDELLYARLSRIQIASIEWRCIWRLDHTCLRRTVRFESQFTVLAPSRERICLNRFCWQYN